MNNFTFDVAIERAYKSKTGELYLIGAASNTSIDLYETVFTEECQAGFVEDIKSAIERGEPIKVEAEHEGSYVPFFHIGTIEDAFINEKETKVKVLLDPENPVAQYYYNAINNPDVKLGRPKSFGFSINGVVKRSREVYNEVLGKFITHFDRVELKKVGVVQQPGNIGCYVDVMRSAVVRAEVTNFPEKGGDKKVSLRNSQYPLFDKAYAKDLKENWPEIWRLGGNIRGNDQYRKLTMPNPPEGAIRLREAWIARHYRDFRIAGVVAQIKWLAIGSRGESYMKNLVNERKDYVRGKRERNGVTRDVVNTSEETYVDDFLDELDPEVEDQEYLKDLEELIKEAKALGYFLEDELSDEEEVEFSAELETEFSIIEERCLNNNQDKVQTGELQMSKEVDQQLDQLEVRSEQQVEELAEETVETVEQVAEQEQQEEVAEEQEEVQGEEQQEQQQEQAEEVERSEVVQEEQTEEVCRGMLSGKMKTWTKRKAYHDVLMAFNELYAGAVEREDNQLVKALIGELTMLIDEIGDMKEEEGGMEGEHVCEACGGKKYREALTMRQLVELRNPELSEKIVTRAENKEVELLRSEKVQLEEVSKQLEEKLQQSEVERSELKDKVEKLEVKMSELLDQPATSPATTRSVDNPLDLRRAAIEKAYASKNAAEYIKLVLLGDN